MSDGIYEEEDGEKNEDNIEFLISVFAGKFPFHKPAVCEAILEGLPGAVRYLVENRLKRHGK